MRCGRDTKEGKQGAWYLALTSPGLSPERARNDNHTPGRSSDSPAFRAAFPPRYRGAVAINALENYSLEIHPGNTGLQLRG